MKSTLIILGLMAFVWGLILAYNPFGLRTWMWAAAGNSRTMAVGYSASLISVLDMAKVIDFEPLIGASNAGRVSAIMAITMIVMRVVTGNLCFKPVEEDGDAPTAIAAIQADDGE